MKFFFPLATLLLLWALCHLNTSFAWASDIAADAYASRPVPGDYESRRQEYLVFQASRPGNGPYSELARMAMGNVPEEEQIRAGLRQIDLRHDCADFRMHGILRLLYQFGNSPLLQEALRREAQQSVLGFKYWPDEPGIDSMCTWSENHHILFSSAAYLAGQLYPNERFTNTGHNGRDKMRIFRSRVLRWLDLRFRTGFSEWLSNVYYDEDIAPLVNLVDFCEDPEIVAKAAMVLDLMLTDIALNSFQGTFGSTHGRSYENSKTSGNHEATGSATRLFFGLNKFSVGNMAATNLALSTKYRLPQVIYEMATDLDRETFVNRQRMGIRIEDAAKWGLSYDRLEDGMTFLSLEAYSHPKTINLMVRMLDEYGWWENRFFGPFKSQRTFINVAHSLGLMPLVARVFERDITRNMRPEVNIYTYRTPDYMLSCAQDYRRGYGGDQQSIWQATLGPEAICLTTHPAQLEGDSPNYWTGSGSLPRAAQVENVALVVYDISTAPGLYLTHKLLYTHAWLPKEKFDEIIEQDGWVFARKGNGYLALWSQKPYHWQDEGRYRDIEIIADGKQNIWVCELGRAASDGTFGEFIKRITSATLETRRLHVTYESPSQGRLEFGWNGLLKQDGQAVQLGDYPRYANPYTDATFPGDRIEIHHNGHWLRLDYGTMERTASAFLEQVELAR